MYCTEELVFSQQFLLTSIREKRRVIEQNQDAKGDMDGLYVSEDGQDRSGPTGDTFREPHPATQEVQDGEREVFSVRCYVIIICH